MYSGSRAPTCDTLNTPWRQRMHPHGRGLPQEQLVEYSLWFDHQGTQSSSQNLGPTSGVQNQWSHRKIIVCRGSHGATPLKRGHRHHLSGGAVEDQCHSPIPTRICTDLHKRSDVVHCPTWVLCAHSSQPRGLKTSLLKAWPIIGIYWGQMGGLE